MAETTLAPPDIAVDVLDDRDDIGRIDRRANLPQTTRPIQVLITMQMATRPRATGLLRWCVK